MEFQASLAPLTFPFLLYLPPFSLDATGGRREGGREKDMEGGKEDRVLSPEIPILL